MALENHDGNKLFEVILSNDPKDLDQFLKNHQKLISISEELERVNKKAIVELGPNGRKMKPKAKEFEFRFPKDKHFCVTMKYVCDFEDEDADNDFYGFARRDEGTFLKGYYATKAEADLKCTEVSHFFNSFVWNREGQCTNGVH